MAAMQCLVLAGGLGTRMRALAPDLPKTLIPVAGVPFAHYQLGWMARHGVTEVLYSIGFRGEAIRDFVADGRQWGLEVRYVEDGPKLLGTGGALRRAFDAGVLREWFLVLYGDSFLPFDFRWLGQAFLGQERPAMMTVYHNQGCLDVGNVHFADGLVTLYQKPPRAEMPYIDYGISAFRRELIAEMVPAGRKCDLGEMCHRLSVANRLAGWEVTQRFYEVGSPAGLRDFETWLEEHPVSSWPDR
jgi:NDP-sugar pyrophosphorylase family protein